MQNARAHLLIDGRVQGVFYRAYTQSVAQRLGLEGWVKNLFDGRVETVFEGPRDLIERAIAELRQGPPAAHVTDIQTIWEEVTGKEHGFEVRH